MTSYVYQSTKTYEHSLGLSVCFRQWRADSHCKYFHGYALQIKLVFETEKLDDRNWVVDFGGLKEVKAALQDAFDHKLLVAKDDPHIKKIMELNAQGIADVTIVDRVGCEAFARVVYRNVDLWLNSYQGNQDGHILLREVEIREHSGNSAIYRRID